MRWAPRPCVACGQSFKPAGKAAPERVDLQTLCPGCRGRTRGADGRYRRGRVALIADPRERKREAKRRYRERHPEAFRAQRQRHGKNAAARKRALREAFQGPPLPRTCPHGHQYLPFGPRLDSRPGCPTCSRERKRKKRTTEQNNEHRRRYFARLKVQNPERYRALAAQKAGKRRARALGAGFEPFTIAQWLAVVKFYGAGCAYCGADWAEQDHVVPLARGGAHALRNLVPACAHCNRSKRSQTWAPIVLHPWMDGSAAQADGGPLHQSCRDWRSWQKWQSKAA